MDKRSTFDFGEHGIVAADADGIYRGKFFYSANGEVDEVEAIRQYLCSCQDLSPSHPDWKYIERLAELAATAEGIPQADGWVAIETGLPDENNGGLKWLTCEGNGFGSNTCKGRYSRVDSCWEWIYTHGYYTPIPDGINVLAWMDIKPNPAPYQRQSVTRLKD